MAQALRQSYGDIFLIKEHPTGADKAAIQGKFKSFHNVSDHVASLMTKTFLALLGLADLSAKEPKKPDLKNGKADERDDDQDKGEDDQSRLRKSKLNAPGLHYNIQIHLPASKDVEVYNSVFKSLKGHLFED
jgi:hypothetical protein